MTEIKGDFVSLKILQPDEEIPTEWSESKGTNIFMQGPDLFKCINNGFTTTIEVMDNAKEFLEAFFKGMDQTYKSNEVRLVGCEHHNCTFSTKDFAYVMKYFQWVYEKYKSEACVVLMAHTELQKFVVIPVLQYSGSVGSVHYIDPNTDLSQDYDEEYIKAVKDSEEAVKYQNRIYEAYCSLINDGYEIYGTIHSHSNFAAFHSATDDADEKDFEGLHITVGHVAKDQEWSYSARYMIKGNPVPIEVKDILNIDDINEVESLVDGMNLKEEHKALMMPNLLTSYRFKNPKPKATYLYQNSSNIYNNYGKNKWNWSDNNGQSKYHHQRKAASKESSSIEDLINDDVLKPLNDYRILEHEGELYFVDQDEYIEQFDLLADLVEIDMDSFLFDSYIEEEVEEVEMGEQLDLYEEDSADEPIEQIVVLASNELLNDDHKHDTKMEVLHVK